MALALRALRRGGRHGVLRGGRESLVLDNKKRKHLRRRKEIGREGEGVQTEEEHVGRKGRAQSQDEDSGSLSGAWLSLGGFSGK